MRRRVGLALLHLGLVGGWIAFGCVGATPRQPLEPPVSAGDHPAVGRPFSVDLEGEDGGEALVEPAPGRVLVACVMDASADPEEGPCPGAFTTWRDRITVIGIVAGGRPTEERVRATSFRLFADTKGRTEEKYRLGEPPRVLVADPRGRVAAVLAPDEVGRLDAVIERLVFGTDSWRGPTGRSDLPDDPEEAPPPP
jgi:hypothetical protein